MTTTAYITSADITSADTALTKAKPTTTFDPTDAAGMKAWYRKGTGITVTGAGVSKWADQSGNGNDLLQVTDTNRPSQEADGSILFDGVDNYLKAVAFTLEQPETIYILFKQVSLIFSQRILDGNALNLGGLFFVGTSATLDAYAGSAIGNNTDYTQGNYSVVTTIFNGASSLLQVDNNTPVTGNASTNDMGGFTLGAAGDASNFGNVQVEEVAIYNTAHDAATRAKVIAYLSNL